MTNMRVFGGCDQYCRPTDDFDEGSKVARPISLMITHFGILKYTVHRPILLHQNANSARSEC